MKPFVIISGIIFFLMISLNTNLTIAQTYFCDSKNSDFKIDSTIKNVEARYFENKVFLKVIVNGLDQTSIFYIERSVDGSNYESIGSFIHYGTSIDINILSCFTDENPYSLKTFYRITRIDKENQKVSSQLVEVTPSLIQPCDIQYTQTTGYLSAGQ